MGLKSFNHVDLFSGIGGFAQAIKETEQFKNNLKIILDILIAMM